MKDYFSYAWVFKRLYQINLSEKRHPIHTKYYKIHDKNFVIQQTIALELGIHYTRRGGEEYCINIT